MKKARITFLRGVYKTLRLTVLFLIPFAGLFVFFASLVAEKFLEEEWD